MSTRKELPDWLTDDELLPAAVMTADGKSFHLIDTHASMAEGSEYHGWAWCGTRIDSPLTWAKPGEMTQDGHRIRICASCYQETARRTAIFSLLGYGDASAHVHLVVRPDLR